MSGVHFDPLLNRLEFSEEGSGMSDLAVKTAYENNNNTNEYSDSEKSKLSSLNDSTFLGQYVSLSALQLAHPSPIVGSFANVDSGIGNNVKRYIWDLDDSAYVEQLGENAILTDAQIKTQYENNVNTNSFTDTEKTKLSNIETAADVTDATNVSAAGALMKTGGTMSGNANFLDDVKAQFGGSNDLQIYHDSATGSSYIEDAGSGNLLILSNGPNGVIIGKGPVSAYERVLRSLPDGAVELYFNNAEKIKTTNTGVEVTGNVVVSGTVDGRDVSVDGTKLDTIETNADVTDTANVVGALTAGTNVTISAGGVISATDAPISLNKTFKLKVPTETEWEDERLSWTANTSVGAINSALKLPMAGYRSSSSGSLLGVGTSGYYWSSTVSGTSARSLSFGSSSAGMYAGDRAYGRSVRLIVDGTFTQSQYNSNYQNNTIEYLGLTYGFVYNSDTQKIWLDRNLGATEVAVLSNDANSYGDLYQWGRPFDGHQIRTSATHNGDTLGKPSTEYESGAWDGKFILAPTSPNDWLSTQDNSLFQDKDSMKSKTFTLQEPTASDDITVFRTDVAITVQEVIGCSTGTSPSTTYVLRHSTDRSAAGNVLTTSTTTSTTTGDVASLSDVTIPANSWIWIETSAASGTSVYLSIDIRFTED